MSDKKKTGALSKVEKQEIRDFVEVAGRAGLDKAAERLNRSIEVMEKFAAAEELNLWVPEDPAKPAPPKWQKPRPSNETVNGKKHQNKRVAVMTPAASEYSDESREHYPKEQPSYVTTSKQKDTDG